MADDLWAELQAAEAVEQKKSRRKIAAAGPRASTLNALSEKTKAAKKKKKNAKADKDDAAQKKQRKDKKQDKKKAARSFSSSVAAVRKATAAVPAVVIPEADRSSIDKVLLRLQRHINELSSEVLGKRKTALAVISGAVFAPFEFAAAATHLDTRIAEMKANGGRLPESSSVAGLGLCMLEADTLSELLFDHLLKPLVRRFTDPSEVCREQAVLLLVKFLAHAEDFTRALPYVFPALMERIPQVYFLDAKQGLFVEDRAEYEARVRGRVTDKAREANAARYDTLTVVEPAEEVRLRLAQALWVLHVRALLQDSQAQVYPYVHDSAILLQAAAVDPFAEVKVLACGVIRLLAQSLPELWKGYCVPMIRRVMPQLAHRHARVRLAVLDAIDACVQCDDVAKCRGAGSEAINDLLGHRDANVLPVAAFYGSDVRINRFAKLAIDGNVAVRRRLVRAVTDWAHNLPDRIDHQARLLPYLLGALHDDNPSVRDDALEQVDRMGRQFEEEHEKEVLDRKQYGFDGDTTLIHGPLPPPFQAGRPPLGSRLFVRHWARRFLNPVLAELGAWQRETRLNAARMLRTIVIYMEDHISMSLLDLIKAVLRHILDPDVGAVVRETAGYLGRFILPSAWVELLLPHVTGAKDFNPNSTTLSQASALVFVTQMAGECSPARLLPSFNALLEALDPRSRTAVAGDAFFLGLSPAPRVAEAAHRLVHTLSRALRGCGASGAAREIFTRTGRLHDVDKINRRLFRLQLLARSRAADDAAAAAQLADAEGARAAAAALAAVDAGVADLGHALSATAGLGLVDADARAASYRAHAPLLLGDAAALYGRAAAAGGGDDGDDDEVDVANRLVAQLAAATPAGVLAGGADGSATARGLVGALRAALGVRRPRQWVWACRQTRAVLEREGEVAEAAAAAGAGGQGSFRGTLAAHLLDAAAAAAAQWLRSYAQVSTASAAAAPTAGSGGGGGKMVIEEDDGHSDDSHAEAAAALAASQAQCVLEWLLLCTDTAALCRPPPSQQQQRPPSRVAAAAAATCVGALRGLLAHRLERQQLGTAAAFPRPVRVATLALVRALERGVALTSAATADVLGVLGLGLDEPDDALLRRTARCVEELLRAPCRVDVVGSPAAAATARAMLRQCLVYAPGHAPLPVPAAALAALQAGGSGSGDDNDEGEKEQEQEQEEEEEEDLEPLDRVWPRLAAMLVLAFGPAHDVAADAVTAAAARCDDAAAANGDGSGSGDNDMAGLRARQEQLAALQAAAADAAPRPWEPRFALALAVGVGVGAVEAESVDFASAVREAEALAAAAAQEPSALATQPLASQLRGDAGQHAAASGGGDGSGSSGGGGGGDPVADVDAAIDNDGIDDDDDDDDDDTRTRPIDDAGATAVAMEEEDYVVVPRTDPAVAAASVAAAAAAATTTATGAPAASGRVPRSPKEAAEMAAAAKAKAAGAAAKVPAAAAPTTAGAQQQKTGKQNKKDAPGKYTPESSFLFYKAEGNRFLRGGEVIDAIRSYGMAVANDPSKAAPYVNRALAHLKLKQFANAVADCTRGMQCPDCDDGLRVKALYRRAKARQHVGDRDGFVSDLRRALEVEPHNTTVAAELEAAGAVAQ